MPGDKRFRREDLDEGLRLLVQLSRSEFGRQLGIVVSDTDHDLAFKRVGRLMAVWAKHPFAVSFPYDPELPSNWAKSRRAWEVRDEITDETVSRYPVQHALLCQLAGEWNRSVYQLAEFNIFYSMCRRLRPIVCADAEFLRLAKRAASEMGKARRTATALSLRGIMQASAVALGDYLVQSVDILTPALAPLVTGVVLQTASLGQGGFCRLLEKFEDSYDRDQDTIATVPICGSLATRCGEPCKSRVKRPGDRCFRHR